MGEWGGKGYLLEKRDDTGKRKWDGGIRFRDLEVFNFYLWAKQEWRIMQQLDYVVAQILKAKYFANYEFLNDRLG